MTDPAANWFDAAFRGAYLDVYAHRDEESARREIAWVARKLDAAAGPVLDAGCGAGRHARALVSAGFQVVGLDRSGELLATAGSHARGPLYVEADFRSLPFKAAGFAGVVSLFTAFGYFDDAGNRRQLSEVRRVLRPGGTYVLDFLNAGRVRATLVPRSERELDGRRIVEARAVRAGRVEKDVEIFAADGAKLCGWRESVRLYDREELRARLAASALAVRGEHGDLAGSPFSDESPRLVLVAEAA